MQNIVLIHGMWSTGWDSPAMVEFLSQHGYRCHTPVLRHHNRQETDQLGQIGLKDYIHDLRALCDTLDAPPILFGHSMGGLLAQILASQIECRALILSSTAPPAGIMNLYPSVIRAFLHVMLHFGFWNKAYGISYENARRAIFNDLSEQKARDLYQDLAFESGRAIFEIGLWLLDKSHAAKVEFARIQCPVLMASGTLDKITPHAMHKQVCKKYPQAVFKSYPHGHMLMHSQSHHQLQQDILNWLQSVGL